MRRARTSRLDHGLAAAALLAVTCACSRSGDATQKPLTYDGSTAISRYVLNDAIPAFEKKSGLKFDRVDYGGGGKGLERLFAGEVELAGVARRLTTDELGRQPYFQIIGYDALAVFVHARNPVKGLSKAQLKAIFTGAIVNWKDAGGPNLPIVACTEPLASGRNTLSVFRSAALDEAPYGRVHEETDPGECLAWLTNAPGGVTFATIARVVPGVRSVPVDGVDATPAHVIDSSYLLSRPLILVTRSQPVGAAAAFFDFMLSPEGQAIVGMKFIPAR